MSKHNFRVGETVANADDADGKTYMDHLYVKEDGSAKIRLDTWEDGVIEEEREQRDFVCWLRNRQRAHGALCIPYEMDGTTKPMFPDFLIVRRDPREDLIPGKVHDDLREAGVVILIRFSENILLQIAVSLPECVLNINIRCIDLIHHYSYVTK